MSCTAPDLGRRLSELPAGVEPNEPALVDHLRECESCATELTQRLRWFASWDRSEPSPATIARLRFNAGSSRRRASTPRLALAYAMAALLATGLASATGYFWQRAESEPERIPPAHPAASERANPPRPAAVRGEPAAVTSTPQLEAPAPEPESSKAASTQPNAPRAATSAQVAETWSEAATALRQGDAQRATRALDDLSRSRDAATRDAARLALAELWMSQGNVVKARPVLQTLSGSGATPLIRKRAQELLPKN